MTKMGSVTQANHGLPKARFSQPRSPNLTTLDPAEWPKIGSRSPGFGSLLLIFPRKNSKAQSSLISFSPNPENASIGPSRVTQLLPHGVAEVKLITSIDYLRTFWCKDCVIFLTGIRQGGVIFPGNYAY